MKRAKLALIVLVISIFTAGTLSVNLVSANFVPIEIGVESPKETTYAVNEVSLTFRAVVYAYYQAWFNINYTITSVSYSIDGKANVTVPISTSKDGEGNKIYSAETTLSGLSEGSHEVIVYATAQMGKVYSYQKNFAVDATPPKVSITSIENKVYNMPDIALNFTTSETCSQIKYVLDGQDNVTIAENVFLTGLSVGVHNVIVYAWDIAGNIGVSETVVFTVAEPEPEPFPTIIIAISGAAATAVVLGLIYYFKNRNH